MSTLFAVLGSSSSTLAAYQTALDVTQNNVGNASTPGYAAQEVQFDSLAFDPAAGLVGGTITAGVRSTRDQYADQSVRRELSLLGTAQQQSNVLATLESNFDVTGQSGVPGSLNQLFSSFSALSINPGDATARQSLISSAQQVAQSFQQKATALASTSANLDQQIGSKVSAINTLASQIQGYNIERQLTPGPDASLDAKVQSALESLSQIVNVTSSVGADGTTTVLLGGQTPLVLGKQTFTIQSALAPAPGSPPAFPSGTPATQIQDENGKDITVQVTQGQLGGLLQIRNTALPALRGDTKQAGSLNTLAQAFADRVNALLTSGNISDGPPPVTGVPLFTYDTTNGTNVAQSLAVSSSITPDQIATIDPGPPSSSNGIASRIAALARGTNALDQINGASFTAFYGQIAASVGAAVADAKDRSDLYQQSSVQAQNLRQQISGVSLDTEAARLIQFQRSYQATTKLITVLDQITQSALSIIGTNA